MPASAQEAHDRGLQAEGAYPALRAGGPERRGYARGRLPALVTTAARSAAVSELLTGVYAASSTTAVRGRRKCYERILDLWGLPAMPISAAKVVYLGAGLRAGGYRSAASVLSQYGTDATREGHTLDQRTLRALTDASRSCRRGLGPPRRALALNLFKLIDLTPSVAPWSSAGPVGPRNMLMIGSWWLLREIEASGVRAAHARIVEGRPLVATLLLPTSKSDTAALGAARAHPCICGDGRPRADCPVHALWDQLLALRDRFPGRHHDGKPEPSLPLFPTAEGQPISKTSFTKTVVEAARRTRQPEANADETLRLSGHSLRASGAQHLARLGMDLLSIQLLGRWGSTALLTYVRDASGHRRGAGQSTSKRGDVA